MKETIVLHAQRRAKEEKAKRLRADRLVPAVVYGDKKENISLKIDASDLLKTFRKAGESQIIILDVDGEQIDVLIHDYQREPVTGEFIHMDFYAVTKGQKLTTYIKVDFVGQSQADKDGAIIEEYIKEIEVSVLPKDLVDSFTADLTSLKEVGDAIRIQDLKINKEIFEYSLNDDDIVAIAAEPAKIEIEEEAPTLEEVPVIGEEEAESETDSEKSEEK